MPLGVVGGISARPCGKGAPGYPSSLILSRPGALTNLASVFADQTTPAVFFAAAIVIRTPSDQWRGRRCLRPGHLRSLVPITIQVAEMKMLYKIIVTALLLSSALLWLLERPKAHAQEQMACVSRLRCSASQNSSLAAALAALASSPSPQNSKASGKEER